MDRFEYLVGLISLIVGLGLADIATSLHRLIKHRSRVRWDGVALTTTAFAAVTMVWIWYNIWDLRDFAGIDGFVFYITLLVEMFVLFLAAAACLPDESELAEPEGWDLSAYYARSKSYIWSMMTLFHAMYLTRWLYFVSLDSRGLAELIHHSIEVLLMASPLALCAALIFATGRKLQWALLIVLMVLKTAPYWNLSL